METKNMVVLIGRVVAEPELRRMPSGESVVNFSLAVNRSVKKDDGSWEDLLDGYFDCEHFGDTAVKFAEDYGKGALVQITGSLHQRKYKTGDGPNARTISKIEVRAKTIAPLLVAPKARVEVPAVDAPPAQLQPA